MAICVDSWRWALAATMAAMAIGMPLWADEAGQISPQAYEKAQIESGLKKLGVGHGYEIVIPDNPDIVENTAAEELKRFLGKAGLEIPIVSELKSSGAKRFLLGQESSLKSLKEYGDKGELDIRGVPPEDDGFHLKRIGKDFAVAGANARGVLYGEYALEDFILDGASGELDIKKVPYFRKRSNAPGYYWDAYTNLKTDEFEEAYAAYLSRLGVNQYCSVDDIFGYNGNLNNLVQSSVFPFQNPPLPDYQRKVKKISALCKKYGIEYYFFLGEPVIPKDAADIEKYPPEAIGAAKLPWGGDENGMMKTLCVNSPIVQEYYKEMMKKFVLEYGDIKGALFYNLDQNSWLCTPGLCPRCSKAVTDSPMDTCTPWQTQAKLVSLLIEVAHEARPDFKFNFWGDVHFSGNNTGWEGSSQPGSDVDKLLRDTKGYDALTTGWDGGDHDIMVPVPGTDEPCAAFRSTFASAKERGALAYVYFAYNRLESIPKSFPFPFHACDALKKFKGWGARNLVEVTGPTPAHNSINALTMKEFQCNPDQDPEKFLTALSVKQFGPEAGPLMYKAWEEVRAAMDVWNGWRSNPLGGSHSYLSLSVPGGLQPPAILPGITKAYNPSWFWLAETAELRSKPENQAKPKEFLANMQEMNVHLGKASEWAQQAVAAASDKEYIGVYYYSGLPRPTCKQYAELNWAPIAYSNAMCSLRLNITRAIYLQVDMEDARSAGHDAATMEQAYRALIQEDIKAQEQFCTLLSEFLQMKPCYTRTALTEKEMQDYLAGTQKKIGDLKAFLEKNA